MISPIAKTDFVVVLRRYIAMEYCEGGDLFKYLMMHGGVLEEKWIITEVCHPLPSNMLSSS